MRKAVFWSEGAPAPAPPAPPPPPPAPSPDGCERADPWPAPPEGRAGAETVEVLVQVEGDGGGTDDALVARQKQHAANVAARYGVTTNYLYGSVITGFAGKITAAAYSCLAKDKQAVRNVQYTQRGFLSDRPPPPEGQPTGPQVVPTGVRRVGGDLIPVPGAGGRRADVDADIAVLDTGVDVDNSDLNVVGGVDCVAWDGKDSYNDNSGHGTQVAGTAAARDNDIGTVGVAPGARIWAVKTIGADSLNDTSMSSEMCAMDWVAQHSDVIDVVNASYGGRSFAPNVDRERTCRSDYPEYDAVCLLVERYNVPFVTIAHNFHRPILDPSPENPNQALLTPGGYDQVLTVSGLADYDGKPGGLAEPSCPAGRSGNGVADVDDTLDDASGYGPQVDLIAPSLCQDVLGMNGRREVSTGTSLAAPLVAGAVALYRQERPGATPAQVAFDLRRLGSSDWNSTLTDDPDGIREPLLDVTSMSRLPAPADPPASSNEHLSDGDLQGWRDKPLRLPPNLEPDPRATGTG